MIRGLIKKTRAYYKALGRKRHFIWLSLLIVIAIIGHPAWFTPGSVLTFGDWQYRHDQQLKEMTQSWQTWVPFENTGSVNVLMSGFPLRGLAWGLLAQAGLSYDDITKITLFIPVAILGYVCMYILLFHLFRRIDVAFFGALFYGSTPYFLSVQTGHLPIAFIYAVVPLMVYALSKAISQNKLRNWLLLSLLFTIGIFYEVRIMYIVSFVLVVFFLLFVYLEKNVKKVRLFGNMATSLLLILILNLFWLIPTKLAAGEGISDLATRGLFGDSLFTISQSFNIMKWNWTGDEINLTFERQNVPLYLWVTTFIAFLGLVISERRFNAKHITFLAITIVGIFLTKQSAEPLSGAYQWLYDHFPGFVLFREASKWYLLTAIGMTGMIGFTLYYASKRNYKWRLALYLIIISVSAINIMPGATERLGGTFASTQFPAEYKSLNEEIISSGSFGRTLWLPITPWWGYYDNMHPRVNGSEFATSIIKQNPQLYYPELNPSSRRRSVDVLLDDSAKYFVESSGISRIAIPMREDRGPHDSFTSYGDDRQYYVDQLNKISWLKKSVVSSEAVTVFDVVASPKYAYMTKNLVNISSGSSATIHDAAIIYGTESQVARSMVFTNRDIKDVDLPKVNSMLDYFNSDTPEYRDFNGADRLSINLERQRVYKKTSGLKVSTKIKGGSLVVFDESRSDVSNEKIISELNIADQQSWVLDTNSNNYYSANEERTLFASPQNLLLVSSRQKKMAEDGSFKSTNWQPVVKNCNTQMNNAIVSLDYKAISENRHLDLISTRGQACIWSNEMKLSMSDKHLFIRFDSATNGASKSGVRIEFIGSKKNIVNVIQNTHDTTQMAGSGVLVEVPDFAQSFRLALVGFPDDNLQRTATTSFDNVRVDSVEKIQLLPDKVSAEAVDASHLQVKLGEEKMANGGFEGGPWKKDVDDCNAYDDKPILSASLESDAANKYLRLGAKRHIACTSTEIKDLAESSLVVFSFKHRGKIGSVARYALIFNDTRNTVLTGSLPHKTNDWVKFSQVDRLPFGATGVRVVIYADPQSTTDDYNNIDYDNFSLKYFPESVSSTYITSGPNLLRDTTPNKATVDLIESRPTFKKFRIKDIANDQAFIMSETYHSGWKLRVGSIDVASDNHFRVNNDLNAWWLDLEKICYENKGCISNSDGSKDLLVDVDFTPQRYFVTAGIVSVVGFTILLGLLILPRKR